MKVQKTSNAAPASPDGVHAPTVILAGGTFPTHATPLRALHAAQRGICCDSAADQLAAHGREPDWIIGDLDSISAAARERFAARLVLAADQEVNDLAKAFKFCFERGWHQLVILGATGGREDHTLGNLSWLVDFANILQRAQGPQVVPPRTCATRNRRNVLMRPVDLRLLSDSGCFTPVLGSTLFSSFPGQPVSIFSFQPGIRIYSEDLAYPLEGVPFTRWWQATLNRALGSSFKLTFEGGPLLVFQAYASTKNVVNS